MNRTGIAELPLHYGKVQPWLFSRMTGLAKEIAIALIREYGEDEFLSRISDPLWFQSLGCVLGFDWHSSGITTTVCGALKEGLKEVGREMNIFIAGGKGATSRNTPDEIIQVGDKLGRDFDNLVYASKISAKIDNTAVQDGYQLYHHVFFFTKDRKWAVVQQGMNKVNHYARRYHWLSSNIKDFVCEPHSGIIGKKEEGVLNFVSLEHEKLRENINTVSKEHPDKNIKEFKKFKMPSSHSFGLEIINPKKLSTILIKTYEKQPAGFEQLLGIEGLGPKSLRALSLIAELIYGTPADFKDPVRYSFAHGGKDGIPYPIDKKHYDTSIAILHKAIECSKINDKDKTTTLRRLFNIKSISLL